MCTVYIQTLVKFVILSISLLLFFRELGNMEKDVKLTGDDLADLALALKFWQLWQY